MSEEANTVEAGAEPAATEEVEAGSTSTEDTGAEPVKEKSAAQARIEQLAREKNDERRQREALEKRLKELEAAQPKPEPAKLPVESDFDDYEQYQSAVADYAAEVALSKLDEKNQAQQRQAEQQRLNAEAEKKAEAFRDKIAAEKSMYEGFDSKLNDPTFADIASRMSGDVVMMLQESEKATALTYHLASNLDVADRIASLPPIQAARELTKIELALEVPSAKKISEAPDPIEPVDGNTSSDDPDKMSTDEWIAWRNRQTRGG